MKLGIIGAMRVEIETLKENMTQLESTQRSGMTFFQGVLEGLDAVVVECGVGKVNAALCVQLLCDCFSVTHIVNTGVAGSLSAALDIGDFVISRDAVYHDMDCSGLSYEIGQVPGMPLRAFPADGLLLQQAFDAAQQVHSGHAHVGTVASGDQFVCDKTVKQKIIHDTNAICTEMEGAAIAHASWRNGIPFVIIRAISDKADDSCSVDYPTFEAAAAKRCAAVTQLLAKALQ